jgi:hypothetical protein
MSSDTIIPGGCDEWGRRWNDFPITSAHTVFEWCMIYTDRHPTAFLGETSRAANIKAHRWRLILLGADGSNEPGLRPHPDEPDKAVRDDGEPYRTSNAVYQKLAKGIAARQIKAKSVYLDDQPHELDLTLCVVDAAAIVEIARRREDHGEYIARLMAEHAAQPIPTSSPRPLLSGDKVRAWYTDRVQSCKNQGEQPTDADDWKAACNKFGEKIRRHQIRALRRELAPNEWRKRGRRTSSKKNSAI